MQEHPEVLPELAAPPGCPVQFEMCHFRALQGLHLGSKWDSEQVKCLVITNYWNTSRYESPSNNFKLLCTNCDQCSIHFQNPLQTISPGIFLGAGAQCLLFKKKKYKNLKSQKILECCTSERDVKNALTSCMSQVLPCCCSNIPRPGSTADTLEQRIFPNHTTWGSLRYERED